MVPLCVVVNVTTEIDALDDVEPVELLEEAELLVLLLDDTEELVEDALDEVELVELVDETELLVLLMDAEELVDELEELELVVVVPGMASHWILNETGSGVA